MLKVHDIMTPELFTLQEDDSLKAAREMMTSRRIRHIPVVDNDNGFVGIITHRDILSATISKLADIDPDTQNEIDAGIPLNEIMSTDVESVSPDDSLRDAAETLLHHKYGCLPVLSEGKLAGILTEADFLKLTISLMDALDKEE